MKSYKTLSGTYAESELAIVVWMNPRKQGESQAKPLETLSAETSSLPMCFPITSLRSNRTWSSAFIASSDNDVFFLLPKSARTRPIIVPLPIARSALGWEDFYIPTEYTDKP